MLPRSCHFGGVGKLKQSTRDITVIIEDWLSIAKFNYISRAEIGNWKKKKTLLILGLRSEIYFKLLESYALPCNLLDQQGKPKD